MDWYIAWKARHTTVPQALMMLASFVTSAMALLVATVASSSILICSSILAMSLRVVRLTIERVPLRPAALGKCTVLRMHVALRPASLRVLRGVRLATGIARRGVAHDGRVWGLREVTTRARDFRVGGKKELRNLVVHLLLWLVPLFEVHRNKTGELCSKNGIAYEFFKEEMWLLTAVSARFIDIREFIAHRRKRRIQRTLVNLYDILYGASPKHTLRAPS